MNTKNLVYNAAANGDVNALCLLLHSTGADAPAASTLNEVVKYSKSSVARTPLAAAKSEEIMILLLADPRVNPWTKDAEAGSQFMAVHHWAYEGKSSILNRAVLWACRHGYMGGVTMSASELRRWLTTKNGSRGVGHRGRLARVPALQWFC